MKYKVTKYYEAYEEYVVEAPSKIEAGNMVMEGQCDDPEDVTVKESDIVEIIEFP